MTLSNPAHPRTLGTARSSAFARYGLLVLGLTFYGIGVFGLVWLILATFGFAPFGAGPLQLESTAAAIAFNLSLVALFGVQHAIMARPAFKRRWTRIVSPAIERSIFTMLAGALMALMQWLWQPLPTEVWSVEAPAVRTALLVLQGLGWAYLFAATFAIDHFELFGVRQVFRNLRSDTTPPPPLARRFMYRFDRHPIMTGALVGVWVTPLMTVGHLVLALGLTAYVIIGVSMEERDLVKRHGDGYRAYRRDVGTVVPRIGRWSA